MWDRLNFFFEDVSRRAGFTSPARPRVAGGATRETDSIFSTLTARRAGHGARARASLATGGPRWIPRRPRRAAPRSAARGRSENGPPVEKNTILLCYQVPLRDVPGGAAQERTEKHTACDIVSYAYDTVLRHYEIFVLCEYLWQHACGLQIAGSGMKSNYSEY